MANLYELLMARERGNIKDAPNKQRIGQAPLNLRSAMKYAVGGLTDADISAYVQANIGNPEAIAKAAQQYQVTAEDLARATGYSPEQVKTYFASSGTSGPYREEPVPPSRPRYEEPPPMPPVEPKYRIEPPPIMQPRDEDSNVKRPPMPVDERSDMEAIRRAQELAEMEKRRQEEEYYFKMRNLQPPSLPPQTGLNDTDPGFTPMPIAPAYPPNYFDPKPVEQPTNVGYPLAPPPNDVPGGAVRTNPMPPSSGLLGSLGGYGLGSGQSSTGQTGGGLGSGLPGQSMQGQSKPVAGMGQSLDSLINYLAAQRKS